MNDFHTRRQFLTQTARIGAGLAACTAFPAIQAAEGTHQNIVLGFMGVNGRGGDLIRGFGALPDVSIRYVCDVDDRAIAKALPLIPSQAASDPKGVKDFRRILDDPGVDALVIAAPDHWHAPAAILACAAGKHVYVEKPASHNPREGELALAAARKYRRVVQVGTQRRSMPGMIEAMEKLHAGEIGRVFWARGWYNNTRASIGHGHAAPVPDWLDYKLWQGPAPERDYRDNLIHYNWHWFWHWGTGELGNNGIHALDLCRWGLDVVSPTQVTSGGGKYRYDDDQETPDSHTVTFDFPGKSITWEGRSWHHRGFEGAMFGAAFYGEKGSMVLDGANYRVYDMQEKERFAGHGSGSDTPHLQNFLDCIRTGRRPNADIEEGHRSTLLCHLGNIAWRTGHALHLHPQTHRLVKDAEAQALWTRAYRPGWEPRG